MYSFRFKQNFIRREDSKKKRALKFTIEVQCQMKNYPKKAKTQQIVNPNNTFKDCLKITFHSDVFHQPGEFRSRLIIDREKLGLYKTFQKNFNLKPSNV